MEDRQRMQQRVTWCDAPQLNQCLGIGGEVRMRDHRALGAARGARGVEKPGEIVFRARHRLVPVVHGGGHRGERALSLGVDVHHREDAQPVAKRTHLRLSRGIADDQLRPRILHEVGHLGCRVGGVERLVDRTRLQHREVEQHIGDGFFHLYGHPVAGFHAQRVQCIGVARGAMCEVAEAEAGAVSAADRRAPGIGREDALEARIEIAVAHASRKAFMRFSASARSASLAA